MDTIKGLALIGTFIGVLITFAMWVSLWDNVWSVSSWAFAFAMAVVAVASFTVVHWLIR
jgi:hypothetical protein